MTDSPRADLLDKWLTISEFIDRLSDYSNWLQEQKTPSKEFKEFAEELLPLRTFATNTDFSRIKITGKQSKDDHNGIDARVRSVSNNDESRIQITLAIGDEGHQHHLRDELMHRSNEGVSDKGRILRTDKEMEDDLKSKISIQEYEHEAHRNNASEYYYKRYELNNSKKSATWYQERTLMSSYDEITDKTIDQIQNAIQNKASTSNSFDILLVCIDDWIFNTELRNQLINKLKTSNTKLFQYHIYIVGYSHSESSECFFYKL